MQLYNVELKTLLLQGMSEPIVLITTFINKGGIWNSLTKL